MSARTPSAGVPAFFAAAALVAAVIASVVAIATTRELSIGREELTEADAAVARADWPEAIAHARNAAEAYVPASPWPSRGAERLASIGRDAEARGDAGTALLAYGAARTAALATRGSDWRRWRLDAEAGLARVAAWNAASGTAAANGASATALTNAPDAAIGGSIARARNAGPTMLESLRRDDSPGGAPSVLLSGAVLAILGGIAGLVLAGGARRPMRWAQSLIAAGLVAYAAVLLTN